LHIDHLKYLYIGVNKKTRIDTATNRPIQKHTKHPKSPGQSTVYIVPPDSRQAGLVVSLDFRGFLCGNYRFLAKEKPDSHIYGV
jgi:hypothetical protein